MHSTPSCSFKLHFGTPNLHMGSLVKRFQSSVSVRFAYKYNQLAAGHGGHGIMFD